MDETSYPNDRPVMIRFGPRPTQEIRAEWAESVLTQLAAKHPRLFGDYLREAALGAGE